MRFTPPHGTRAPSRPSASFLLADTRNSLVVCLHCSLPLVGEGGRLFHTIALMAMARGMAGRKDKPLVAIEFAEERVRHEVAA